MNHSRGILLASFLLGFGLLFWRMDNVFSKNIALVLINQSLNAPTITATQRQQQLARAARLLNANLAEPVPDSAMIPAILQGLAYLRAEETAVAAKWFQFAATAHPYPEKQQSIWISPWMFIDKDNSLVVSGSSELWRIRPDNLQSGTIQNNQNGTGTFNCNNHGDTARAAFQWIQPYSLNYHHTIQVEALIENGSTLIIETNIDGKLQRPLTINGKGEWETSSAPITGTNGKLIYLIVTQDSDEVAPSNCAAQIKSIQFLLDNTVTNHKFD